jgi:carbonic anhydrase/SulP family sulfate permease
LIRDYQHDTAEVLGVRLSLLGFRTKYGLQDTIQYVDYSTKELQEQMTPHQALQLIKEGNERFASGHRISRDFSRQVNATSQGQNPFAVVLSCIDSRVPVETILDQGLGDLFSVRVAGNVTSPKVLGSMEYGCAVAGSKLILVLGHTKCGAVTAAVDLSSRDESAASTTGCQHLDSIMKEIRTSIGDAERSQYSAWTPERRAEFVEKVAKRNVQHSVSHILDQSQAIRQLVDAGRIAIVGAIYDVSTGRIEFALDDAVGMARHDGAREISRVS